MRDPFAIFPKLDIDADYRPTKRAGWDIRPSETTLRYAGVPVPGRIAA